MKTRVLILCTGNSNRSQMAEGFLRHYGGERFEVESAGSIPCFVNPTAIEVMAEIGIDISGHRSKHLIEFIDRPFDYVITVCDAANDACPVFPGPSVRLHWPFPDPPHGVGVTEGVRDEFRKVRDRIGERFRAFALEPSRR
ncbi:MAG TPA: arsenate reductase ArsC [Candidatus Eisenbacteria bacterium]|jgi:arsenate reductase|nr:arsenate reductase ArsC [Candidatus Eisenbacteria bacterium]